MKGKKTGGREKGTPNKRSFEVEEIAAKFEMDPFEVLMMFVCNDWEGLGYEGPTRTIVTAKMMEIEVLNISPDMRLTAAKEASKYLHAQKKSLDFSGESSAIKIIIEDYANKK